MLNANSNNNGNRNDARAEYNAAMNRLAKETENYRREHEHRNGKFMTVKDIDDSMRNVNLKSYQKDGKGNAKGTIVVCDDCGAVFDTELFTPDKLEESLFIQESVLHQMKMLFKFDADEYNTIVHDCFDAIETLRAANRFYNNAVKDLKDNNVRKNNNGGGSKNTAKGGIGINRSMFNTKNF